MTTHTLRLSTGAFKRKPLCRAISAFLALNMLFLGLPVASLAVTVRRGGMIRVGDITGVVEDTLDINQNSPLGIIDWNMFGIANGETVSFNQTQAGALTVNRVTGQHKSDINGTLNASYNVWLLNPVGVDIGSGAIINAGSFVAAAARLEDSFVQNLIDIGDSGGAGDLAAVQNASLIYSLPPLVEPGATPGTVSVAAGAAFNGSDGTANAANVGLFGETVNLAGTLAAQNLTIGQGTKFHLGEAAGGKITLSFDTSTLGGALDLTGAELLTTGDLTVGAGSITFDTVIAANLTAHTSAGNIDQADVGNSRIMISGLTDLSVQGDVFLDRDSGGFVNGLGTVRGDVTGDLTLGSAYDIVLGPLTVGENLTVGADRGTITQSGTDAASAIKVDGKTELTANKDNLWYDIALDNANNDFGNAVSAKGRHITLANAGGIELDQIEANFDSDTRTDGTLTVTSTGGDITQTADGSVSADGATTLTADGFNITLDNADNNFKGAVNAYGMEIELVDGAGDIDLNDIDATTLTVTALDGGITQETPWNSTDDNSIVVSGLTTLEAAGDITLNNRVNDFEGGVTAEAVGLVHLADANTITLTDIKGTELHVEAGNEIVYNPADIGSSVVDYTFDIFDSGDFVLHAINSDTLTVILNDGNLTQDGVADVNALTLDVDGIVTLDNGGNDFDTVEGTVSGDLTLVDKNGVEFGALEVGTTAAPANLAVTAGGDITQTADGITIHGETDLIAVGANIKLDAANDFVGPVHATGINTEFVDVNTIELGNVDASGTLDVTALDGDITQTTDMGDTLVAVGVATLVAEGNAILLDKENNNFQNTVNAYADNVELKDANDISIGVIKAERASDTAAETVIITTLAGGSITDAQDDAAANVIAGQLLLDAAGDVGSGANPFDTAADTLAGSAGGGIWLVEGDALTIGTVDGVSGLTAAQGVKLQAGGTLTVDEAVTAGGDILLAATGASADLELQAEVNATDGNISLLAGNLMSQNANVNALADGKSIDAEAGSITIVDGFTSIAGGDIRYRATTGDAEITGLQGVNIRVEATEGNITDAGDTNLDVDADTIQLVAGGSIGGAPATSAESDDNALAIDVSADSVLAAQAGGSIYVQTDGALTIGLPDDINLTRVTMDGSQVLPLPTEKLAGAKAGENAKFMAGGDLTIDKAMTAEAGDLLLQTTAGDIMLDATLTAGNLATVIAADALTVGDDITAGGDIYLTAGQGIDWTAGTVATTGGNVLYETDEGDINVGVIDAGAGKVSLLATIGSILDANDDDMNITATGIRLEAGKTVGADGNALDIKTANLELKAGGDTFLRSEGAVNIGGVDGVEVDRAWFDSGTSLVAGHGDLTGIEAGAGLTLAAVGGDITQTEKVVAEGVATLTAEGNNVVLDNVDNDFKDVVNAYADEVYLTDGVGDLTIGIIKAEEASAEAAAKVVVTTLDTAAGNILDAQADTVSHNTDGYAVQEGDARVVNITATELLLDSAGNIGETGNPLDISAGTLAATSGNIWLYETDALAIGSVEGVDGITASGHAKIETIDGTLTVGQAVSATAGDILLAANGAGSDLVLNAAVDASVGNITLLAANGISQKAAGIVTAGGTVDAEAFGGSITMDAAAATTAAGNIRYAAKENVALGLLDAGTALVSVEAEAGDITDAAENTQPNIKAGAAQLTANGSIGGTPAVPAESDNNPFAIDVALVAGTGGAGTLAAEAKTGSAYIESVGAVTIDNVAAVTVNRVTLDDDATAAATSPQLGGVTASQNAMVKAGGKITVNQAVTATAGDLLLLTTSDDILLDAGLAAGRLATVIAVGAVNQNADINAGGDVHVRALGGGIAMADGTATTSGGNIRYIATGNVALGSLAAAGNAVSVIAGVHITDASTAETPNITAAKARLLAGGSIGGGTVSKADDPAAIDLAVGNVEAFAGGDIHLREQDALTIGGVGDITTTYVRFDSGTSQATDGNRDGITAGGTVKVKAGGALAVNESVTSGGDTMLFADTGDITLNANVNAGGGAWLDADAGSINMAQSAKIEAAQSAWLEASQNIGVSYVRASSAWLDAGASIHSTLGNPVLLDVFGRVDTPQANIIATSGGVALRAGGDIGSDPGGYYSRVLAPIVVDTGASAARGRNITLYGVENLAIAPVTVRRIDGQIGSLTAIGAGLGNVHLLAEKYIIDANPHGADITAGFLTLTAGRMAGSPGKWPGSLGGALEINVPGGYKIDIFGNNAGYMPMVPMFLDRVYKNGWKLKTGALQNSGVIFFIDGQFAGGDPRFFNRIASAEAFAAETPELKPRQGIFDGPVFLHDHMYLYEPVELCLIEHFLPKTHAIYGAPEMPEHARKVEVPSTGLSPRNTWWLGKAAN